ncbi:HECT-domain (ubiquitin-transferase) domain-containing protein [Ditylenchus destructor]|nr:HECT-domain (ubiquitin-transferase) domain-containing protein [Ditylenchus destructor]
MNQNRCLGDGEAKPPGFYVRRAGGLFPAFLPQGSDTEECKMVSGLFTIFGVFLAKVLQDNRLVDIPLSPAFLRLILSPQVSKCADDSVLEGPTGPLTIDDFQQIHPVKAKFLRSLQDLVRQKQNILENAQLSPEQKAKAVENLRFKLDESDHECSVEDLGLTFAINPPSSIFHYDEIELIENGAKIDVTVHNVEDYVDKCLDYYLHTGIREQVAAFRQGFDQVFPLASLTSFTPEEVQILLSGEQCPQWTRDDIMKYTEPKLGYTRDSPGFLHFVDVLVDMNASERKSFLQFTTGCSSLPPGGLANLHPRLTVVKKAGEGGDGSYPSVNTCVHYLKLPEYSSGAILRERLLAATYEKGFHLN